MLLRVAFWSGVAMSLVGIVQFVSRNKGALGYFGLAYYEENKDKLKAVPIKATDASPAVLPSVATVNDGTCVWTCIGNTWLSGEVNQEEWVHDGLRNRMGYGPPTAGLWRKGDKVWAVDVSAGGYIGWVCINTGVPGPWKGFGAIAL